MPVVLGGGAAPLIPRTPAMTNEQRVVECGGGVNEVRRCAGRTHAVSAGRNAAARPSRACRDRGIPRRGGTASLTCEWYALAEMIRTLIRFSVSQFKN
ncbi:Os10g0514400 [Oryza sativa Japonica Group]|uniref:Os10g0514400 protein n=3 Tax=Oryza sativa subsp. japonica TaxID=39947 RepID=B9G6L7_ORYSJ|nr:hypothetical protein OsJ_32148 [Oryza sativa Japonica Group]BAT11644.1 Os10g0514400 [Oryza sativa Japonica Group]